MSVGFLLFMAQGVLRALDFRSTPPGPDRVAQITLHGLCQSLAVLCAGGGLLAIFQHKEAQALGTLATAVHHFTTTHGQLGVAVVLASVGAGLGGSVAFQKLGLLDKLGVPAASPWRGRVKAAHREVGTITLAVAVAVAWMGLSYPKRFMGGVDLRVAHGPHRARGGRRR